VHQKTDYQLLVRGSRFRIAVDGLAMSRNLVLNATLLGQRAVREFANSQGIRAKIATWRACDLGAANAILATALPNYFFWAPTMASYRQPLRIVNSQNRMKCFAFQCKHVQFALTHLNFVGLLRSLSGQGSLKARVGDVIPWTVKQILGVFP